MIHMETGSVVIRDGALGMSPLTSTGPIKPLVVHQALMSCAEAVAAQAVHDLVLAGAARDNAAAAVAAAALDRFGSSSGADVAYGLRTVFTHR